MQLDKTAEQLGNCSLFSSSIHANSIHNTHHQQQVNYQKITNDSVKQQIAPQLKMNRRMMQSLRLQSIEDAALEWIRHRLKLILDLEVMITELNQKHEQSSVQKVGGVKTSIIGASLIVGGILGAPLTLGSSLMISSAGIGCFGLGTGVTLAASIKEWNYVKKMAKTIQEMLRKDTEIVNDMILRIFDHKKTQPEIEYCSIIMGEHIVNVSTFLDAFLTNKYSAFNYSCDFRRDLKETCCLATILMKGIVPILSVPVDLISLVQDTRRKSNVGSEKGFLTSKLLSILNCLKIQTEEATGVEIYFHHSEENDENSTDD